MLNRSASLAMSTSILKALSGKPDIKRHSPSILFITTDHVVTAVEECYLISSGMVCGHSLDLYNIYVYKG